MDTVVKLQQLEKEMAPYTPIMAKAADTILEQDVSKYPIFVVHQQTIDMGIELVDRAQGLGKWTINASTLEEFVTKQLISSDKVDEFRKVYKNPETHLCLFILSDLGATFAFILRSDN